MSDRSTNLIIAGVGLAFAGLALAVWIPSDIETGLVVKERRSVQIGDALAPTVAAAFIAVFSVALAIASLGSRAAPAERDALRSEAWPRVRSMLGLGLILAVSMLLFVFAGPAAVDAIRLAGGEIGPYRTLIATPPYNYIGFVLGGVALVAGAVAWIEGRCSAKGLAIGVGAVATLILLYDLPFDTLLLPPNGDQ